MAMHISPTKQDLVHSMYAALNETVKAQLAAVESFRGDIYSGLRALDFTPAERQYAQEHLYILSGLYGILRPYDAILPYRLEAAYRIPDTPFDNLYAFWKDDIAAILTKNTTIINLMSKEYEKLVTPYLPQRIIRPRFLTVHPKTKKPTLVAVHLKIARGAYARWLIKNQVHDFDPTQFDDLGYHYDAQLSEQDVPTYVCDTFGGLGLSQRSKGITT